MQPPLPEEAQSLGTLLSVYREHHPLANPKGGMAILAGIALVIFGSFVALNARGPSQNVILFKGAAYAISGIVSVVYGYRFLTETGGLPEECIFLMSGGLVYFDKHRNRIYSWGDIRRLGHRVVEHNRHTEHQYTIDFDDGSQLLLDSRFPSLTRLGYQIQKRCEPYLYKRYVNEITAARPVDLGDLRLDREGITVKGKQFIPYDRIKHIDPKKKGHFYLREVGKVLATTGFDESSIPVPVLVKLLNFLIHEKRMRRL